MKPMLASKLESSSDLRLPVMASAKLDGVRALVIDGVVMSRNFKPIPSLYVQEKYGRPEFNGLDGELILGDPTAKDCYRDTVSAVMTQSSDEPVNFHVFDDFTAMAGFRDRYEGIFKRLQRASFCHIETSGIAVLSHRIVTSVDDLDDMEAAFLSMGHEGVMVRSLDGPYKYGRSTTREGFLLKMKRFKDCEAIVWGFDEKWHNANELTRDELGRAKRTSHRAGKELTGTLGAVKVRGVGGTYDGVEFDVGTGYSDAERQDIWDNQLTYTGKIMKVKYFPTGSKDKPRFPTFLGWRPEGA